MITYVELAERMKQEILKDVSNGVVPNSVLNFSELHDYVDANLYGGTEELLLEISSNFPNTDEGQAAAFQEFCETANAAMEIVNTWLKSGSLDGS